MSFDKIIGKNIIKNISESLSGKYSQKRLDHAKQSAKMGLKLLQREPFKKKQKQLVIWLVIKFKKLQQNNSEKGTNENDKFTTK